MTRPHGGLPDVKSAEIFEKRNDVLEFLSVAETGNISAAANWPGMIWMQAVLPLAVPKFHETCARIEPKPRTADFRRGLRLLADGGSDSHYGGVDIGDGFRAFATLGYESDLPESAGSVRPGEDFGMGCANGTRARRFPGRIRAAPREAKGLTLGTAPNRAGEAIARRMSTRAQERSALYSRRGLNSFHRAQT